MTTADAMLDAGQRWREANPDLARQMLTPQLPTGEPGVGKHGPTLNIPNDRNRHEPWSGQDDEEIMAENAPSLAALSERLGRSKAAISTRRCAITRQGHIPLRRLTTIVGTEGKGRTSVSMTPFPMLATYQGACWQPDYCQMDAGRCRPCERRVAVGQS